MYIEIYMYIKGGTTSIFFQYMYHLAFSLTTNQNIYIFSIISFLSHVENFPPSLFHFIFSPLLFPDSLPRQNISRPSLAFPSNHQRLVSSPSLVSPFLRWATLVWNSLIFLQFPSKPPSWATGSVTFKPQSIPICPEPSVTSSSLVYSYFTSCSWPDHLELKPLFSSTNAVA